MDTTIKSKYTILYLCGNAISKIFNQVLEPVKQSHNDRNRSTYDFIVMDADQWSEIPDMSHPDHQSVIVVCSLKNLPLAVSALQAGASTYLVKEEMNMSKISQLLRCELKRNTAATILNSVQQSIDVRR